MTAKTTAPAPVDVRGVFSMIMCACGARATFDSLTKADRWKNEHEHLPPKEERA